MLCTPCVSFCVHIHKIQAFPNRLQIDLKIYLIKFYAVGKAGLGGMLKAMNAVKLQCTFLSSKTVILGAIRLKGRIISIQLICFHIYLIYLVFYIWSANEWSCVFDPVLKRQKYKGRGQVVRFGSRGQEGGITFIWTGKLQLAVFSSSHSRLGRMSIIASAPTNRTSNLQTNGSMTLVIMDIKFYAVQNLGHRRVAQANTAVLVETHGRSSGEDRVSNSCLKLVGIFQNYSPDTK